MANLLKMATIDTILALHQRHWSIRRIAKELGLHRKTVARYIERAALSSRGCGGGANAKCTTPDGCAHGAKVYHPAEGAHGAKVYQAPLGSAGSAERAHGADEILSAAVAGRDRSDAEQPASPVAEAPRAGPKQASLCEPWRQVIVDKLAAGLTAQRIYQDLVSEHGFGGKYHSVRRFVRQLGHKQPLPFRRMECGPGDEAQVDFGSGAPIVQADGRKRRTHVFRIVLSHSRRGYSEAVFRQTAEEFLRCLENAFQHFGGVPKSLVLDNLKAAVEQPDWFDPELNPKLRSFAEHYGLAILPTRPRMPRHKGKIESGVGYVKKNALKGHVFASLDEENRHLLAWETTVADVRIHGTIRRQVGQVFAEVERAALVPLPGERFPFFQEGRRTVHRDGHVEVAKAYYSVPPEYLGREVWVRWDGRLVRIFDQHLQSITVHVQVAAGRFSTQRVHIAAEKISAVERGADWLLRQVRRIGPHATGWAEAMLAARGIEGVRVLQGLRHLADRHPWQAVDQACAIALAHACYRLRIIRQILRRNTPRQQVFEFMNEHAVIRSLAEYDQFVHQAIQQERTS
jgi:transposase